MSAVFPSIT